MRYEVFTICKLRCGRETACCNNGIMLACGQAVNIAALGIHRVLPNLTFKFTLTIGNTLNVSYFYHIHSLHVVQAQLQS